MPKMSDLFSSVEIGIWDAAMCDAYGVQCVVKHDTRITPKLSRVPRGHWRNLYRDTLGQCLIRPPEPGVTILDEFHYLGAGRWPSREIAEQKAKTPHVGDKQDVWIDAEFFPAK